MSICPQCRFENVRVARFCIECGTRLATSSLIQQERKKVTVLFADVTGFTKLSESMDPEELTEITSEIYRIMGASVYKFGGTVDKYLGDGVMVLFGAPKSHENDNERALLCALDIRRQLKKIWKEKSLPLQVCVGINAGVVISGKVGDDQRQDYTALGDVVNVAKRFEENARGGQILVAESIYTELKHKFEWQALDRILVKGKSERLKVYELTRLASQKDLELISGAGLAKLVGREADIQKLENLIDAVSRGESVEMGLFGEPGLGKSRMIYELRYYARRANVVILRGSGASHTQSQSFNIFNNMMRNYLGLNDWEDGDKALERTHLLLDCFDGDPDKHERVGAISYMMGYKYEASTVEQLSQKQREELIMESLIQFLKKEALRAPLLIVFDDLHWVDRASALLLETFRQRCRNVGVGLLLVGREDEMPHSEIALPENGIRLRPFNLEQTEEYLQSVLVTQELPTGLVEMLYKRSRGNPFFAEELIKKLLIDKVVQRQGNRFVLAKPLDDFPAPLGVQELLMSRIDTLDAETKRVLQCAAVIGETFPFRVLKILADAYEIELENCLESLTELQLVFKKSLGDELEYVFKHSLLRDVAYDSLLRKHQRDIHLKTAHAFEVTYPDRIETFYRLLAKHYERAGMAPQAARYLLEEVEQLLDRGEGSRAREALTQARSLGIDFEIHTDLYLDQVRLQLFLGIGLLEESLGDVETDDPRVLLHMTQLRALVSSALAAQPLHDLPALTGEVRELGVGTLLQSWTSLRMKDFSRAEQFAQKAKHDFADLQDRVGQALALEALALSQIGQGEAKEAQKFIFDSLQHLGSDLASHLGWLRLTPLSSLLGEKSLLSLFEISGALNDIGFRGSIGYFLEDREIVARQADDGLMDRIKDVLKPLLSRQREGLLRLLSFRGQVDLVVRPCVYWILREGTLPQEVQYLAMPGTFLRQIFNLIEAENKLDQGLCEEIVGRLLRESAQRSDDARPDILGVAGIYYTGFSSQKSEGQNLIRRAVAALETRPSNDYRNWALQRLKGFLGGTQSFVSVDC